METAESSHIALLGLYRCHQLVISFTPVPLTAFSLADLVKEGSPPVGVSRLL